MTSARAIKLSRAALEAQRQATLDRLREGPRKEVIARAEAQVAVNRARLDEIQDEIDKATIRAPFDGVITDKLVDLGRYVREGDALFDLVQTDPVRAVLAVTESNLGGVAVGQPVRIRTAADPSYQHEGKVDFIIPRGDPAARTFPVKLTLPNKEGRLLPGMGLRGSIEASTPAGLLAVPTDALVETPGGTALFVVRDGKAVREKVRTTYSEKGFVSIEGNVAEGESVVVLGNETLRPGADVAVVPRSGKEFAEDRP